jgi:predicted ABC-type ATPase
MPTTLLQAVNHVLKAQKDSQKPLAIILAGHNGSGKSTMWYSHLADQIQIPLINADRMMMSILPEVAAGAKLPTWAATLRDSDEGWMHVAQDGVYAFVAQALANKVPFATETVFSYWKENSDGTVESKIDWIKQIQASGYFVILFFVGLTGSSLSIARVLSRVAAGGHNVPTQRLLSRFPRTQKTIGMAVSIADAAILVDNSLDIKKAFSVCRIQMLDQEIYDVRTEGIKVPLAVLRWLDIVSPRT